MSSRNIYYVSCILTEEIVYLYPGIVKWSNFLFFQIYSMTVRLEAYFEDQMKPVLSMQKSGKRTLSKADGGSQTQKRTSISNKLPSVSQSGSASRKASPALSTGSGRGQQKRLPPARVDPPSPTLTRRKGASGGRKCTWDTKSTWGQLTHTWLKLSDAGVGYLAVVVISAVTAASVALASSLADSIIHSSKLVSKMNWIAGKQVAQQTCTLK